MKNVNVKKLALAGILVAVGVVCSTFSIPVGASKCAPAQHFINILGGVFLGPSYAVAMAFVTSLLRNLLGDTFRWPMRASFSEPLSSEESCAIPLPRF